MFIFGVLIFFDAVLYATELPFDTWKIAPTDNTAFFEWPRIMQYAPIMPEPPYAVDIDYYPSFTSLELFLSEQDI